MVRPMGRIWTRWPSSWRIVKKNFVDTIRLVTAISASTRWRGAVPNEDEVVSMFDSVLERNLPRRQVGRGAIVSAGIHAALIVLGFYLSSRPRHEAEKDLRAVMFFNPPPPPPPPPPGGGGMSKPKVEHKTVVKKPDPVVQSKAKPTEQPETPKKDEPQPGGQQGGVVGGVQGGVVGGVDGGVVGGVAGGRLGGTRAIPFGAGMTRPTLVSKVDIHYTQEARAARVEGVMLVKCVITEDGSLQNCRVVKPLPYVTPAVLAALTKWKYTPVTFQGKPVSVEYVIPVRVVAE
jgi:protein TonB